MRNDLLKDFVLMHVHERLNRLVDEYDNSMHPALKELNDVTKDLYENIIFKVRSDVELGDKEALELYCLLIDASEKGDGPLEFHFQSCMTYSFPVCKDVILERELQANYANYSEEQS